MGVANKKINLTPQQIAAIECPWNEPVAVIAGAGTGKTSVLIKRIIHLIEKQNISYRKICVITFTNEAVKTIRNRLSKRRDFPLIDTFHKTFLRILWETPEDCFGEAGNKHWDDKCRLILEHEQCLLVETIIREDNDINDLLTKHRYSIVQIISKLKLKLLVNEFFVNDWNDFDAEIESFYNKEVVHVSFNTHLSCETFKTIFKEYCKLLRRRNLRDFDDIILCCNEILDIPEVAHYWNEYFDVVLVDEFQDIDEVQFQVIQKILGKRPHIFCVGDPDQSIYGFRGSKPKIFDDFLDIYPQATTIKLEQNYRSTKNILEVANQLIDNNDRSSFSKVLVTDNEVGESVHYFEAETNHDEIDWVIEQLKILHHEQGVKYSDCLILYRNNYFLDRIQNRFKQPHLRKEKIKFNVLGKTELLDSNAVKMLFFYLNICFYDGFSLAQKSFWLKMIFKIRWNYIFCIHNLASGTDIILSKLEIFKKIENFAKENEKTFFEAAENFELISSFNDLEKKSFQNFWDQISQIKKEIKKTDDFCFFVDKIISINGYNEELIANHRLSCLSELNEFKNKKQKDWRNSNSRKDILDKPLSFEDFVKSLIIEMQMRELPGDNFLNLSTIHCVKGLEYDHVFVVHMMEDILPDDHPDDPEEHEEHLESERRLTYVAFTRAKKRLFLSCCREYGRTAYYESRFIDEVKEHLFIANN